MESDEFAKLKSSLCSKLTERLFSEKKLLLGRDHGRNLLLRLEEGNGAKGRGADQRGRSRAVPGVPGAFSATLSHSGVREEQGKRVFSGQRQREGLFDGGVPQYPGVLAEAVGRL